MGRIDMGLGKPRQLLLAALLCGLALSIGHSPQPSQAWQQPGGFIQFGGVRSSTEGDINGVFLPTERTQTRKLELGRRMLEEQRYVDAVKILGGILDNEEDWFFTPDDEKANFRSLKVEARRLLGQLPSKGLDEYELQFGAGAKRLLAKAVESGDVMQLAEVSRRYFHTTAGYEATLLLGHYQLDHGRPLAAALAYQQLLDVPAAAARFEPTLSIQAANSWLRAGDEEAAQNVLAKLQSTRPDSEVRIGSRSVDLFAAKADSVAWLEQQIGKPLRAGARALADGWHMFRGDPSRNAESAGGTPLLAHRWDQRMTYIPKLEEFIDQFKHAYLRQSVAAIPSLNPLAIRHPYMVRDPESRKESLARDEKTGELLSRDTVVFRTALYVRGVDFQTGKLLWEIAPPQDNQAFQQLAKSGFSAGQNGQVPQLAAGLEQRLWDDAVYGGMSSDGERVYVIQDLGLSGGQYMDRRMLFMGAAQMRTTGGPKTDNRLVALELAREGYRVWEVGGPDSEVEELTDAFFLGAPLPMDGDLYVLAEVKGSVELVVLDAKTGALEWRQQLAVLERDITQDPYRRIAGATPSFSNGVLVCPTSAGAVVAVDLTSRSLLWAYKYPQQYNNNTLMMMRGYNTQQARTNDRWLDGSVTLVDGRVLLTPLESTKIHCLNLIDGKVLWTQDRGEHIYLGCVHDDKIVLVGKKHVTAIELETGKQASGDGGWPQAMVQLPDDSLPSGRGYYSAGKYYLPTTNSVSGEVMTIDLEQGRVVHRTKSRDGRVLGNLICYRGEVLSQGVDFLGAYYQVESLRDKVARTLENSPDDAEAIARLGEIEMNEGNLAKAIEQFRRSFQLDSNARTRDLLVGALLEGVRRDFAANRDAIAELEELIDQPDQKIALLRMVADGLRETGETMRSFESYLKLVDLESTPAEGADALERVDENLSVRRDRWIQAQLSNLRSLASDEERRQMDAAIDDRLAQFDQDSSTEQLRKGLSYFGAHAASDRLREVLVDKLMGSQDARLECQMLLGQLERSADPARRGGAVARMARLLQMAKRSSHAAIYFRRLATEFADVVCLGGETGRQLAGSIEASDPVHQYLAYSDPWSRGEVRVTTGGTSTSRQTTLRRQYPLDLRGEQGPFFEDTQVVVDQQLQAVVGFDALGEEQFNIPLNRPNQNRQSYIINPNLNHGAVNGHLLVVSMGYQIFGIDTLSARSGSWENVLWRQDLTEEITGVPMNRGINARRLQAPGGLPRFRAEDGQGRAIGIFGPLLAQGVTFQRFRELVCIHPLTGETLWVRRNIPQGSDLFGDEELLFVVRPGSTDALVLSALDGAELGTCKVPAESSRMTTIGRRVLAASSEGGRSKLSLIDPWKKETAWSREFNIGAKTWLLEGEAVGVMEPDGEFVLLSLTDGSPLIEEQLLPESLLTDIYILNSADQRLLITNRAAEPTAGQSISATPGGYNNPLITGHIYAFDRASGKQQWSVPASVEQQGLMLPQPAGLPMLAFVRHVRTQVRSRSTTKTSVLCLDKRTGRPIYENDDFSFGTGYYRLAGSVEDSKVTIMLPNLTINLHYTNDPVAPEPPLQAGIDHAPKKPGGGIFKIFGAVGRALGNGGGVPIAEPAIEENAVEDDD
jgi:outer membrane protein assembly factor BamB